MTTNLIWLSEEFHPSIFTAKDDNTVGVAISGSTANPTNYYGGVALNFSGVSGSTGLVSCARFSYLSNALACVSGTLIKDAQFVQCKSIVNNSSGTFALENVLGWQLGGFQNVGCSSCSGITLAAQNATFDNCTNFLAYPAGSSIYLTNCILAEVTNWQAGAFATNSCAVLSSDSGIFQTAGAGSHYLASGSPYRNAGTTNIEPVLLTNLAAKTTYPPIVYSNTTISVATTFNPQAGRDGGNSTLDLGYAYDPLDWVFGGVSATANLTFTAGTAGGWFELPGSGGPGYGIGMGNSVTNTFTGSATAPCWWVRYSTVQEGGNGLWKDKGYLAGITSINANSSEPPEVIANFLHCGLVANDPSDFEDDLNAMSVHANECEFTSGNIGGYANNLYLTNCLFDRKYIGLACGCSPALSLRNCTFHGGQLYLQREGASWPIWIENCAFDNTAMSMDDPSGGTNVTYSDFNAFLTNAALTSVVGTHCVSNIISFNWESGPLGNYYQPSNNPTIQKGSVEASVVGLYHYTVTTNLIGGYEIKETNSIVTIGYHYVATDAYGNPIDTNGDGIPDYLEDINGNGLVDSGELGWNITGDPGLTVLITEPKNNSVIP